MTTTQKNSLGMMLVSPLKILKHVTRSAFKRLNSSDSMPVLLWLLASRDLGTVGRWGTRFRTWWTPRLPTTRACWRWVSSELATPATSATGRLQTPTPTRATTSSTRWEEDHTATPTSGSTSPRRLYPRTRSASVSQPPTARTCYDTIRYEMLF